MAIDAGIYGAIQAPKQVNPLEQFAQVQQIQSGQNQNKLAELMLGDKQRENEGQTALANAYKSATDPTTGAIDRNKLYGALAQGGQGAKLPTVQKGFADQDKAAADMQKAKIESGIKELDAMGQILAGVKDQASWDRARAQAAQMFGPEKVNATMPAQYDAALVGQKRDQALSVKDQLEQKWKAMEYTTPKADARLSAETSRANNAASNAVTMRGQNLTDARSREANQSGKIPPGYRATASGGLEAIPGGPADLKTNAAGVAKVSDAKDVLGLLDEVDALLPDSTGSYGGAAYDAVKGAFGGTTKGAQTAAQLKALQGALVSKMPKMSGPQSDKDVLLYREMAGQVGDQTIPVSQRQAASSMIRKLNEKYAGMPEGSSKKDGKTGDWSPPPGGVVDFGSLK